MLCLVAWSHVTIRSRVFEDMSRSAITTAMVLIFMRILSLELNRSLSDLVPSTRATLRPVQA